MLGNALFVTKVTWFLVRDPLKGHGNSDVSVIQISAELIEKYFF